MTNCAVIESSAGFRQDRPLCVGFDGVLLKNKTYPDSLLLLIRARPLTVLSFPMWLLRGKGYLNAQLGTFVGLDVPSLPFNRPLLSFLRNEYAAGRDIYLIGDAGGCLAEQVASHLGIFSAVIEGNDGADLSGYRKLLAIEEKCPDGFDYVGSSKSDLPILSRCVFPMLANPSRAACKGIQRRNLTILQRFEDRKPFLTVFVKAIRLHQWPKNCLIAVPLLLAHAFRITDIWSMLLAFLCFSLCASSTYIVNDLLDVDADRRHPIKQHRAIASGDLSVVRSAVITLLFLTVGLLGSTYLPSSFVRWLIIYLVATLSYSLALKKIVCLDVILLAGLYTLRILAGGAAVKVTISPWLAAFSSFFFLSLAMVKRFSELHTLREAGKTPANGRGYKVSDIDQVRSFGTASGIASIVVFSLYVSGPDLMFLYKHQLRLWLVTPLLILWISRVWLLADRGLLKEDPVLFAMTDIVSLLIGAAVLSVIIYAF